MVRKQNRLGALQVRVARHDDFAILFRRFNQLRLQFQNQSLNLADLAAHIKMSVERDLVIATASRVKSAARRPD